MRSFATASQDLTDIVKNARSAVGNKTLDEAMKEFAGLFTISADQLRNLAVESLTNSQIRAFIPTFYLDPDNRVIAQHSGMSGPTPSRSRRSRDQSRNGTELRLYDQFSRVRVHTARAGHSHLRAHRRKSGFRRTRPPVPDCTATTGSPVWKSIVLRI